jgi:hypothetical protein
MGRKGYKSSNYYQTSARQRQDEANRRLNIVEAGKEKLGVQTTWETLSPTYTTQPAPQSPDKTRHRATKIAYSKTAQTLVIKMRDGVWIGYENTSVETWNALKSASSTNDFINAGNLGAWHKFDPSGMPEEVRVLFNS